mgnify:CR=1 FL=1
MKKNIIVLAVAISAVVSGYAMAWEANGNGGTLNIGGTLTPAENITPWEVKTGNAVTGLSIDITKGQSVVNFAVDNAIPILGIRTAESKAFKGAPGISPQISYGGAVNVDKFAASVAPLTLEVKNTDNAKIGSLTTNIFAQGRTSQKGDWSGEFWNYAGQAGQIFFGGLPKSTDAVSTVARVNELMPEVAANYISQDVADAKVNYTTVSNTTSTHNAYYFSAIEPGNNITITLDSAAKGDEPITWKASLPITVSYQ